MSALIGGDKRAGHLLVDDSAGALDVTNLVDPGVDVAALLIHHFVGVLVGGVDSAVTKCRSVFAASALWSNVRFARKMRKHRNSKMKIERISSFCLRSSLKNSVGFCRKLARYFIH